MRRPYLALLFACSLACGCPGSIMPQFEDARDSALAKPGPVPANWEPDMGLLLHDKQVDWLVEQLMRDHKSMQETFGVSGLADVSAKATVKELTLRSGKNHEALTVDAKLGGVATWRVLGLNQSEDFTANVAIDLKVEVKPKRGAFTVLVRPVKVRSVKLSGLGGAISTTLGGPLTQWIEEDLLSQVEPLAIGDFGSEELPLRALKIIPAERGLAIGILSNSPSPETVSLVTDRINDGFRLTLATDTLIDLAKKESFEAGAVGYDVVVEPLAFDMGRNRDFVLVIRLWRVKGKGWWRDVAVHGTAEVKNGKLALTPTNVEAIDKSKGALLVDPLAALGKGVILSTIEKAVTTSLPLSRQAAVPGKKLQLDVKAISGSPGKLVIAGSIKAAKKRKP